MRPAIHFTPKKGWMNDPNGLILVEDTYHIFYQHYPEDTKWGPMHWGHAVSKDLIHFEELEIALYPTEEEYIFSGSAILDEENLSGLGDGIKPAMLLFYTSHNPKTGEQMQSLAYSKDYIHFEKYAGNPMIQNRKSEEGFKPDFRDPKVFKNTIKGGYSMVLAAGDHIEFWHTKDLLHWDYSGNFFPGEYGYSGICECPDLMEIKEGAESVFLLTMSMIFTEEAAETESHVMQYFVGTFDGNQFSPCQDFEKTMVLDYGEDNYAMVSFSGTSEPLVLGWGEDWNKARVNQATEYFGKMTLARKVSLKQIGAKHYVSQEPIIKIEENTKELWTERYEKEIGQSLKLPEELLLENQGKELIVTRKEKKVKIPRVKAKSCLTLEVVYDHGYYEIFADDGIISFSQNWED